MPSDFREHLMKTRAKRGQTRAPSETRAIWQPWHIHTNVNTVLSTDSTQKGYTDTENLETAWHILCECPAFTNIRAQIYHDHYIDNSDIFKSSLHKNIYKIVTFFEQSKCLSRTPKLTKKDLSPKRSKKTKRKNSSTKTKNDRKIKHQKITSFGHSSNR